MLTQAKFAFFLDQHGDTPALPEAKTLDLLSCGCYSLDLDTAPGLYEADLGGLLAGRLVGLVALLNLSEKNIAKDAKQNMIKISVRKNTHTHKKNITIEMNEILYRLTRHRQTLVQQLGGSRCTTVLIGNAHIREKSHCIAFVKWTRNSYVEEACSTAT